MCSFIAFVLRMECQASRISRKKGEKKETILSAKLLLVMKFCFIIMTVLKITTSQWTMSGLIGDLTGQTFIFPVMLTCHIRLY